MFTTEVFEHNESEWKKIKSDIISLENEAFGDKSFTEEEFDNDFLDKNNIIILLKDGDKVIGFTYAKPVEYYYPERINEKGETALIHDTVIKKDYRGKKLVGILVGKLEEELKKNNFKYLERHALVANNYAENISKYYKDRIIKSEPHDSEWGPQIFFRIRL